MTEDYKIRALDANSALLDEDFVETWKTLLQQHSQPSAVYASPEWVAHLLKTTKERLRVWSVQDRAGNVVGVIPVRLGEYVLQFAVSNRVLCKKRLSAAFILGSTPPLPQCCDVFSRVVRAIFSDWALCDAVYVDAVSTDSHLWQTVQDKRGVFKWHFVHVVDGPRPWHLLKLESSFDAYLKTMSSKARANLRREVRKVESEAGGRPNLFRCTVEENVDEFLRGAAEVSRRSWQQKVLGNRIHTDQTTRACLEDLTKRGILRSYLLRIGDESCAFVVGYQLHGVYCYAEIGFDERFVEFSPGKVLLFLIIEDLHNDNPPLLLDFGVGDATYKRRFGNCEKSDASCLFLRKTAVNWLLMSAHSLFERTLKAVKVLIGRRVTK